MSLSEPHKDRLWSILRETAKVAVVAWGVVVFAPLLTAFDPIGQYVVATIVGALLLELILAFLLGPPRAKTIWSIPGDPVAIEEIVVRTTARKPTTGLYSLKIVIPPVSLIGMINLRLLMLFRPTLAIVLPEARMRPEVRTSRVRDYPTVIANSSTHGFDIDLGPALTRAGDWHWATVLWTCDEEHEDVNLHMDYRWKHRHWWVRVLLWVFIRRPRNVNNVRLVRR
ncbi:hypothetical protein [Microbacterium sp.]|uniref:hypothetical protein n=1 Tax=Microbacterium sp. TaxID=51671 RepID=UPI003A9127A7